jgi:hypothetical protein
VLTESQQRPAAYARSDTAVNASCIADGADRNPDGDPAPAPFERAVSTLATLDSWRPSRRRHKNSKTHSSSARPTGHAPLRRGGFNATARSMTRRPVPLLQSRLLSEGRGVLTECGRPGRPQAVP